MSNADAEESLVGAEISAVVFTRDYVQLQLEKQSELTLGVTFIDNPAGLVAGNWTTRQMDGWRDRLCDLIGRTIEFAAIDEQRMSFALGDDRIDLPFDKEFGPESAHLNANDRWWVW
jgi:hypothetical protein